MHTDSMASLMFALRKNFRLQIKCRLNSSVSLVIIQNRLLSADVSGQHIGPDIKPLKMGPIGFPETSVIKQPALLNNPEDGKIQVNRCGSLRCRRVSCVD